MHEKMATAINFPTCLNAIVSYNVYLALHDCLQMRLPLGLALCTTRNGKRSDMTRVEN